MLIALPIIELKIIIGIRNKYLFRTVYCQYSYHTCLQVSYIISAKADIFLCENSFFLTVHVCSVCL